MDWSDVPLETLSAARHELERSLNGVFSADAERRRKAVEFLSCEVANQGHLYSASVLCVDFVAAISDSGGHLTPESLVLLERILNSRNPGLRVTYRGGSVDVAAYCRQGILDLLPRILDAADGVDVEFFKEVCFLVPQLADSTDSVIEFLRRAVVRSEGDLLCAVNEALEEAEDVVREGHME